MSKCDLAHAIQVLENALSEMRDEYDSLPDYENVQVFPMQPIHIAKDGCVRFKQNRLVDALLDHGQATGFGLNELARKYDSRGPGGDYREDWNQLAQLMGYSTSGFGDLSYARPDTVREADKIADELWKNRKDE